MIKIYHNPRCRKSREGLAYLEGNTKDFEIVDYLRDGISEKEVSDLAGKMGAPPSNLVRTQEDYYKKELKGRDIPDDEWPAIISENPRLLQRPVVVKENRAVLAQPPEKMDILL